MTRNVGKVSAATFLSRVLGLVRDQVFAGLFGAGTAADAFNMAFRVPNLLRDLFAEGAMSASFVPTFTQWREQHGEEAAWQLGRQLMATLLAVLLAICALGWIFAPQLVHALAGGFAAVPGKLELTVTLTRIMLLFLPAVALAAAAMGMLNARGVFFLPAVAPALLNVGMIVFGLALIPVCRTIGWPVITAMAFGVVLGGVLQFACQLPALAKLGFRFRLERPTWHPGVRRVATLMLPATIGLAATQLNIFVSQAIAAGFREGSVSWLQYAFRLMQLPIGLFGVAVATVSLPALSRAAVRKDLPAVRSTLSESVRLVLLLTVPSALFLAVMAQPILALLFQHGRFHAGDTVATADALVMYCIGLPAFAAVGIFTRAFYALGDTRTPVRSTFVAVGVNLGLNLLFVGPLAGLGLAHRGLALATSATAIMNLAQLSWRLRQHLGGIDARRMARSLLRILAASALTAAALAAGLTALGDITTHGLLVRLGVVAGGGVVSLAVLFGALRLFRVEELAMVDELVRSVRGRLGGR
ncbi:MAG: murein biosynthesis integral membrane protein MurJ [Candidatus Eisenbacteria bacterium]